MATGAPRPRAPNAALLVRLHLAGMAGVALWGVIMLLLGNTAGALYELFYFLILIPSVLWIHFTERHIVPDVWGNIVFVFFNGIAMTWAGDGVVGSGAFVVWCFICPMAAMVWVSLRAALVTSGVYLALLVVLTLYGQALPGGQPPPDAALPWMITYNLIGGFALVLLTLGWFIARLEDERAQNLSSQARLLESQRFEALATLAGGIAHDFNNAFMAISGNLQLASAESPPDSPVIRRIGRAQQALEQATGLAHQMLAFSSGGAPSKSNAPIAETIERAASFVLSGSPVKLELDVPEQELTMQADREQLGRLVQQLVGNAAQSMPAGGTITLRMRLRVLERSLPLLEAGQECVLLEVCDRGAGIPTEHLGRLFDPFFTTRDGHAGLGLTEAFTIARDHGGAIEVESKLGVGSCFRVWLPAGSSADEATGEIVPSTPAPVDPGLERAPMPAFPPVLIMDDEPAVLEVLSDMLDTLGYPLVATEHGEAALEAWRQAAEQGRPFGLAIFDLTVRGGMGGVDAARRLRESHPEARIVASSGYVGDRALTDYRQHGFDAVLRKPYSIALLGETLDQLLP
jgi:signal transduction histidine kinase